MMHMSEKNQFIGMTAIFMAIIIILLAVSGCGKGVPAEAVSTEAGIYVEMNLDGVYSLGYYTDASTGGVQNADGTMIQVGEVFHLIEVDQMGDADTQASESTACTIMAYDENGEELAAKTFMYQEGSGRVDIELTKTGQFIRK